MARKITYLFCSILVLAVCGTVFGFNATDEAAIKRKFGDNCKITDSCADMVYVDCNAAADGPAYFLDKNLETIGTSGGFCMSGQCSGAPAEWTECQKESPTAL